MHSQHILWSLYFKANDPVKWGIKHMFIFTEMRTVIKYGRLGYGFKTECIS